MEGKLESPFDFTTYIDTVSGLDFGDVNKDGFNDLVLSGSVGVESGWGGRVEIHYQDPITHELVFSGALTVQSSFARDVNIADINSDGRDDILVTADDPLSDYDKLSIFYQNIDGSISSEFIYDHAPISTLNEFLVDDMDDDGDDDIVVNTGPLQFSVIKQDSSSIPAILDTNFDTYNVMTSYSSNFRAFAIGDLNGDLKNDIAAISSGNYTPFNIFYQNDHGTMDSAVLDKVPVPDGPPHGIEIADVNGDGLYDIVGDRSDTIMVWYQNPDHTFRQYTRYTFDTLGTGGSANFKMLTLGDVTGDGLPDAVVTWSNEGLFVLPNMEYLNWPCPQ